jgi:hypothetical protein
MHLIVFSGFLMAAMTVWYLALHRQRFATNAVVGHMAPAAPLSAHLDEPRRAETPAIDRIEDPAVAAGVMMIAVAQLDGELDIRQKSEIQRLIAEVMGHARPAETFARAEFAARGVYDPNHVSLKFTRLWFATLTTREKRQLIAMTQAAAAIKRAPSLVQQDAVMRLQTRLGMMG